jgi:hypothetical protein
MTTTAAKGEGSMTDFQFRALIAMVLEIMEKSEDLDEAKRSVRKFVTGNLDDGGTDG